jgi:diguanylate cyclase (GGDEF)-like protein/PAS domain S-box-containing protein
VDATASTRRGVTDAGSRDDAMSAPQRVAWLMHGSSDAAMLTDPQGHIEYVNPAFEALTGWSREEVLGRTPAVLKSGLQSDEVYQQLWRTLYAGQEFRGVLVNRRRNGALYHEEKSIRPLVDATGRITHLLSLGRDVSERVAAMAQLRHTATHDALTGLPNRVLFLERLDAAINRVRRGGAGYAVVLADVDAFKLINDAHGHAAGDAVLQAFAERMLQTVRKADTVARLGGDEFALLLEGTDDEGQTGALLESIARGLSVPVPHGEVLIPVSASLGACVDACGELGLSGVLELADAAMYRAKRDAAGRWHLVRADRVTVSAPLAELASADAEVPAGGVVWRSRSIAAGEALYRQGQRCASVYVMRQGSAVLVRPAAQGGPVVEHVRHEGEWLGLDGVAAQRHICDAFVRSDAVVWVADYHQLLAAARVRPELMRLLLDAFAREAAR